MLLHQNVRLIEVVRIIRYMLYLFKIRKLIKITLEEYANVTSRNRNNFEAYHNYPTQTSVCERFKIIKKSNREKVFSFALAIAEEDGYTIVIPYTDDLSERDIDMPPALAVSKKGIKFMTPTTFFNILLGAISPVLTLIIASAALTVSIIALGKNQ